MPEFRKSTKKNKKYDVYHDGKWIAFGDVFSEQFKDSTGLGLYSHMDHGDFKRREAYRKRASGIKNGKGELTYKDKNSPNYWSYHFLW